MKRGEPDSLIKLAPLSAHLSESTYHGSDWLQLPGFRSGKCQLSFISCQIAWPCTISLFCNSVLPQGTRGRLGQPQPGKCSPELSPEQNSCDGSAL